MSRNLDDMVLAIYEAQRGMVRDQMEIKVGSIANFLSRVEERAPLAREDDITKPRMPKFMGIDVSEHPLLQAHNGVVLKNGMPVGFFNIGESTLSQPSQERT